MKKNLLFVLIGLFVIFSLTGCFANKTSIKDNSPSIAPASKKDPSPASKTESGPKETIVKEPKRLIYASPKFGFSLEFPRTWEANYTINEYQDYIEVCFIGESKTSKNSVSDKVYGLTMFYIGNEKYVKREPFIDSVHKVGTSRKVNYYYFTNTDYPLGALIDNGDLPPSVDEVERQLIKKDHLKAQSMEKDIENILKTFKPN